LIFKFVFFILYQKPISFVNVCGFRKTDTVQFSVANR
jgi:hypothetical protein